ncbi:MAG: ABC-F family ATP-binding cassette domain-containing protein [Spirosomataceae bacterium]
MLTINQLSFYFGGRTIFEEASLQVKPKDKIGLIGLNGKGKSTLLKLIVGEYQPDGGQISKSGDCTIGFLNQDLLSYQTDDSILSVAMQAFERELALQEQIEEVLQEMETNYRDELVDRLGHLQAEFDHLDGYSIQAKAEEILEGLGFKTWELQQPLRSFSGGWRMRVMLAKLLLQKPALLLLDEPTNHLDLPSIQWVEKYVQSYENAVMVVSHDRDFLDNVCSVTVEVANHKLNYYPGNYSFYLEEKALRNEIQRNAFENQQAQIRQTERFIERFKAKATKARQVQSRVKALDRMDLIDEVIDETARVHFKFRFGLQPGRHVMELNDVSKAYGEKVILSNTTAKIERGDKIVLIGANGKGKSTLLRIIAGTESIEGERKLGHQVKFSFYAQHQLESLHLEETLVDELKYADSTKSETELRALLGCFLFSGEDVFKKIKVLSGGEKSRVALAKILISEANFLLLDEPTNHLDMQSVNILIQALDQYEGTYVIVSHDRHFISQVSNKVWYIEDEEIKEYPGGYDEFAQWMEDNGKTWDAPASFKKPAPEVPRSSQEKPTALTGISPQQKKKLAKEIEELEQIISELEVQKAQLESTLADPSLYEDVAKASRIQEEYQQVQQNLVEKNVIWEEKMLQLEEA